MGSASFELGRLWTASPKMALVLRQLEALAPSSTPVMLLGESGTGKELAAEALHEKSPRSREPFVVVDCGSVPAQLIESELFGHVRGAFTGAESHRVGAFEFAGSGTLFIDELGELPSELQPKLLRVLEKSEIKPVGTHEVRRTSCRVLSATHRDLDRAVANGAFRSDLYYRLAGARVVIPPLRSRPEDILGLAEKFIEQLTGRRLPIDPASQARMLQHAWPGNVRELRNAVEAACALADDVVRVENLDPKPRAKTPPPAVSSKSTTRPLWEGLAYREAKEAVLSDFEQAWLSDLLKRHRNNVSAAAKEAGIHRNLLHRMIAKYRSLD